VSIEISRQTADASAAASDQPEIALARLVKTSALADGAPVGFPRLIWPATLIQP
jgi:hypothetical protein